MECVWSLPVCSGSGNTQSNGAWTCYSNLGANGRPSDMAQAQVRGWIVARKFMMDLLMSHSLHTDSKHPPHSIGFSGLGFTKKQYGDPFHAAVVGPSIYTARHPSCQPVGENFGPGLRFELLQSSMPKCPDTLVAYYFSSAPASEQAREHDKCGVHGCCCRPSRISSGPQIQHFAPGRLRGGG